MKKYRLISHISLPRGSGVKMKFDKSKLDELVKMSDKELWDQIVTIGASYGFRMPKDPPPHEQMEALRSTVTADKKPNVSEALRILNSYRKEAK